MKIKLVTLSTFIFAIVVAILIILHSLQLTKSDAKDVYEYQIEKEANFKVYLKENNFLNQDFLEEGKLYISNLIDYITIDMDYKYNSNQLADLKYAYDIYATLYVDYQSTTQTTAANLWTKKYDIIKDKFLEIKNDNTFQIQESINLDYDLYKQEVINFKQDFSIPINAYLKLELKIKTMANLEKQLQKEDNMIVTIELQDPVSKVITENTGTITEQALKTGEELGNINKVQLTIGIILLLGLIVAFVLVIRRYAKEDIERGSYLSKLIWIRKNYSDILIEVTTPIKQTEELQIIDVRNFEQLVDLENEVRIPILEYEEKGQKTIFVIIYEKIAYQYILHK